MIDFLGKLLFISLVLNYIEDWTFFLRKLFNTNINFDRRKDSRKKAYLTNRSKIFPTFLIYFADKNDRIIQCG